MSHVCRVQSHSGREGILGQYISNRSGFITAESVSSYILINMVQPDDPYLITGRKGGTA